MPSSRRTALRRGNEADGFPIDQKPRAEAEGAQPVVAILELDDVDAARLFHARDGSDPARLYVLDDEAVRRGNIPARRAFGVEGVTRAGKDIVAVAIDIHGALRYQGRVRSQGIATPCKGRALRVVLALEACDC